MKNDPGIPPATTRGQRIADAGLWFLGKLISFFYIFFAALFGMIILAAVVQSAPSLWSSAKARLWPPPTLEECRAAADAWRLYGKATLSESKAQHCIATYGR